MKIKAFAALAGTLLLSQAWGGPNPYMDGVIQLQKNIKKCMENNDCEDMQKQYEYNRQMEMYLRGQNAADGIRNNVRQRELRQQYGNEASSMRMQAWQFEQEAKRLEAQGFDDEAEQYYERSEELYDRAKEYSR